MIRDITGSTVADEIVGLETALNCQLVASDGRDEGSILSPDFYEFGASGAVWSRAAVLGLLRSAQRAHVQMSDVKALLLSDDTVLLTYVAKQTGPGEADLSRSLRASIWVKESGQWQIVFHQGTVTE